MKNSKSDKIILLFSADWFVSFWSLTGIVVSPGAVGEFQRECRISVREMMDRAHVYWDISFSENRILRTRESLLSLIRSYDLMAGDTVNDLLEDRVNEECREAMLVNSITPLLFRDAEFIGQASLTFDEARLLQCKWEQSMGRIESLRDAETCVSEWDRYLAALTPDIPDMLKDFAVEQLAARGVALEFWSAILKLPPNSQKAFLEKYRTLGEHLAGVSLTLRWLPGTNSAGMGLS